MQCDRTVSEKWIWENWTLCMHAQLCLILCDPMNYRLPGSSVHGVFLVRLMEQVAISSSGYLAHPGIEPMSPVLAGGFFSTEPPGKPGKTGQPHATNK